jgi:5,10-methylenetetrahydromethanopterin reductase
VQIVELASRAEAAGFDRYAVSDWKFFQDCFVLMTACLQATKAIEIESVVTEPYVRNVAVTAAAMATMADLSEERTVFGIGGGVESSSRVWTSPWGHERPHPLAAVREAVDVSRRMWRGDEVTHRGKVVRVEQAKLSFASPSKIPVCIAARSPKMQALAGEIADIVHVASFYLGIPWQRQILANIGLGAQRAGRPMSSIEIDMTIPCSVSDNRDDARQAVKRLVAQGITWMTAVDEYALKGWRPPEELVVPEDLVRLLSTWNFRAQPIPPEEIRDAIDDRLIDQFAIAGTPAECAERLRSLASELPEVTGFRIYAVPAIREATLPYPYEAYVEAMDSFRDVIKLTNHT